MTIVEPRATAEPVVAVSGLAKSYGGRPVLRDLSFTLAPGQILGLVGANGGGKTTTLRLVAGVMRRDGGDGTVLGQPLGRPDRRRIGYMTQASALHDELTVRENLRFRCAVFGLVPAARHIAAVAEHYALDEVIDRRAGLLSGGWARRAHFAATVIHTPPLLLLDEPTAGLDIVTRRAIWDGLHRLADESGTAIIVSTHDLPEAAQCDAVLFYRDGAVDGPMTPAALVAAAGASDLESAVLTRSRS